MSTPISFQSDGAKVHGRYFEAPGVQPLPTVLLLQGSPGNPSDVLGLGERFAERGYNVLTFNYRGTCESEGLSSFGNAQADIEAALAFLSKSKGVDLAEGRLILGGWSYGGGMAMSYAAAHSEIRAVFSVAGTDHGEFMREYQRDAGYRQMIDAIFDEMAQPGSPWRLAPGATPQETLAAGSSVDAYDLRKNAPGLRDRRVLLIGSWDDVNVKIESHMLPLYRSLVGAGADQVSVLAFNDDHSFSRVRFELADAIIAWMDNWVRGAIDSGESHG